MKKTKRVAIAVVRGKNNTILMGRRRDDELMTFPGGTVEAGEKPADGMCRELYEETGLTAISFRHVKTKKTQKGLMIYIYEAECEGDLTTQHDPDREAFGWFFCDPLRHCHELHVPLKYNTVMEYLVDFD